MSAPDLQVAEFLNRGHTSTSVIEAVERAGRAIDDMWLKSIDTAQALTVDHVLGIMGKSISKMGNMEGAPQQVVETSERIIKAAWAEIHPTLRESICGPVPGDYSTQLVRNWAQRHPRFFGRSGWPQPYTFVRAHILYALYPADRTIFMKLRSSPLYLTLMALKLSPIIGIPIFALQFMLIDRRDEYQVVNFILSFKMFQFLIGVYTAISLAMAFYMCLGALNMHAAADQHGVLQHGEPHGSFDAAGTCNAMLDTASSGLFPLEIALELLRVGLTFYALHLLQSGRTCGGVGELKALAEVRLDAADGNLDGHADVAAIALDGSLTAGRDGYLPNAAMLDAAKEAARIRFKAERGSGSYLPLLMRFDMACLGLLVLTFAWQLQSSLWTESLHWRTDMGWDQPMVWHTLYYLKITYALAAWPFMAFFVPVIGAALHGAHRTGYDMAGLLVPQLGNAHIRRKIRIERARALAEEKLEKKVEEGPWRLAWRTSSLRRWLYGVLGLLPPVRAASRALLENKVTVMV